MANFFGEGSGALLTIATNSLFLHPLDILILSVFLVTTLIVGLSHGWQVKTLPDYALGGKRFSTFTLTATIVATWFGGGSLYYGLCQYL